MDKEHNKMLEVYKINCKAKLKHDAEFKKFLDDRNINEDQFKDRVFHYQSNRHLYI